MTEGTVHNSHIVPAKIYIAIWAALLVLTVTTVLVSFVDLGAFNPVLALVIATIKATLVALFFMHLRGSSKMTIVVVIAGVFWLFIMLSFTMTDYLSRAWSTNPSLHP